MKEFEKGFKAALQDVPSAPMAVNEKLAKAYAESVQKPHKLPKAAVIVSLAAAAMLCGAGVYAASSDGEYLEIRNQFGAVTGGEYRNATSEIEVCAEADAQGVTVSVTFVKPDEAPYFTFEEIRLTDFQIIRLSDGIVMKPAVTEVLTGTESSPMTLYIPMEEEVKPGAYELHISAFEGASKADQPLPIEGSWMVTFEAE